MSRVGRLLVWLGISILLRLTIDELVNRVMRPKQPLQPNLTKRKKVIDEYKNVLNQYDVGSKEETSFRKRYVHDKELTAYLESERLIKEVFSRQKRRKRKK